MVFYYTKWYCNVLEETDMEFDLEELYAKPMKKKRKYQMKTNDDDFERKLLTGYDEVGAFIEGTYAKQESIASDPTLVHERSGRTSSGGRLEFLNATTPLIQDDPYEIIGKTSSFSSKREEKKTPTPPPRRDLKKQESDSKSSSSSDVSFKPIENNGNNKNMPSSFKPGGSVRQQRTSIRRGKFENNPVFENVKITPPSSRKGSPLPLVRIQKNEENKENQEETKSNKTNSFEIIPNNLDATKALINKKDRSYSYEEIWNDKPKKSEELSNSQLDLIYGAYETIPDIQNKIKNSKENIQNDSDKPKNKSNLLPKHENDTDSGYEEIWSYKQKKDNNTNNENKKENKTNLNYTEIETVAPSRDMSQKSNGTRYVDVDMK